MTMNIDFKNLDFHNRTVLTVGDVMLDQYVLGTVDRISPEAPIPIFTKSATRSTLGGSGNVAKNIHTLGANSILLALTGDDNSGVELENLCKKSSIEFHKIMDDGRPTTRKQRYIAKSQQIMRMDDESADLIDNEILSKTITIFDSILNKKKLDAIIIQDYNKGFLHPKLIKHIIASANNHEIPTIVDPKFKNLECYNQCTAIKPNQKEISKAINRKVSNELDDLAKAVGELKHVFNFQKAYVTLGANGIYNYQTNDISKGYDMDVLDITGAGDSVVAMLSLLISTKLEESEICPILNVVGNLACRSQGAYGVKIDEIRAFRKS